MTGVPLERDARVTGHLQVQRRHGTLKWLAQYHDRDGVKHTKTLGRAHVKDSGRRTARGAIVWRAGDGPCSPGALTPKAAEDKLAAILDAIRAAPRRSPPVAPPLEATVVPTFSDAVDLWLAYLEVEKRRKASTRRDAYNVAHGRLLPRFGAETPLYRVQHVEVVVTRDGRQYAELREERVDTFMTEDVDDYRLELLNSDLSPRSAQKILILLHGIFKLARRRKLIAINPSADAERITLEDDETFNILEPDEFETVYRAVLGEIDERPIGEREPDAIDLRDADDRLRLGAALSTSFYAGLRMGELRDLSWRHIDFNGSLIRVESAFTAGVRSTPKGRRARATPMVDVLAQRLAQIGGRVHYATDGDYVFATEVGTRISDDIVRKVFYAGLVRAGLGHKRAAFDRHGNPQWAMRVHDLRHSWCSWAVNVWPVTKVKEFAGHRDIKTTMRYVHHQTKAEDAEAAAAYLAGAVRGAPRLRPPRHEGESTEAWP